ncbi:transposase [Larkinella insperata]|uniref:Transposase n=1 Tax=Larkinella insperata TaxID=332158 RepID=A0ABW3Q0M6_9BACT
MHESLQTEGPLSALRQALKGLIVKPESLIHHSDRGIQYCSREYTKLLKANKIRISMTEQADPYENALAERMNRTLKEEFALDRTFLSAAQARQLVKEAIAYYNQVRPHASCGYKTPEQAHHCQGSFVKMWRSAKRKSQEKVQDQLSYAYA